MEQSINRSLAEENRDRGIQLSYLKANADNENWGEIALDFLRGYAQINPKFQTEDVRFSAQGIVPVPKSNRAWGAVMIKAAKEHIIAHAGFENTKSAKSHRTPASVWKSLIVKK